MKTLEQKQKSLQSYLNNTVQHLHLDEKTKIFNTTIKHTASEGKQFYILLKIELKDNCLKVKSSFNLKSVEDMISRSPLDPKGNLKNNILWCLNTHEPKSIKYFKAMKNFVGLINKQLEGFDFTQNNSSLEKRLESLLYPCIFSTRVANN